MTKTEIALTLASISGGLSGIRLLLVQEDAKKEVDMMRNAIQFVTDELLNSEQEELEEVMEEMEEGKDEA